MSSLSRRDLLLTSSSLLLPALARAADPAAALAELERRAGGRLGVALLDTASGRLAGHRLDERFGMCSTFKLPLAGLILREVDQGRLALDQFLRYGKTDLVPHAPVTSKHLEQGGMTVAALAEAAQTTSDNVAANLLLRLLGGPAGFTAKLRALGDADTRLDRLEPEMNLVPAGEVRDTSTPAAMARTAARLLTSDALSPASIERLSAWMIATDTGLKRLRAGLPATWRAGDKTGTATAPGMPDKYNDVAIAWPPGRPPILVSAFYETPTTDGKIRDEPQAVLAEAGRIAAAWANSAA